MPAEEFLFRDGLGDRLLVRDESGKPVRESLLLTAELSAMPSFEFSLNQRLIELEQFDHPSFVRVRRLVRAGEPPPRLCLEGDYGGGTRLSDVLAAMEHSSEPASAGAVLFVAREILDAVSALHRESSGVAHGALAAERIVVNGTIRITDYVLGSAVEQLRFSAERYWKELRVAVPASAGAPRLDRRADVAQIGMIALALFAGRPLRESEHMGNLDAALAGLSLPVSIKTWLLRMLHLDSRRAYVSAIEATQGLEDAVAEAGIRPTPLVFSPLGIRLQRVSTTATSGSKAPPPVAAVKKAPLRPAVKQDPWIGRDVDHNRRAAGQRPAAATDETVPSRFGARLNMIVKIGLLGAALAAAFTAAQYVPAPSMLFSPTGTLVVESNPSGAAVFVDAMERGVTPLALKLKSGKHEVELRDSGRKRVFNVYISSGASVSQYVELRGPDSRPRKSE